MPHRRDFLLAGGAALAASLAALAGPALAQKPKAAKTARPKPRTPAIYTIGMKDMVFAPIPTGLHVGDTIEWFNDDFLQHSATAKDKSFDYTIRPNTRVKMVLTKTGDIPFACRYHPGMKGVLSVGP
ncbi:MAG TPA: hypothetical protein VG942_15420 [Hyphomonadaceae bacterium]|nr:hypothetical protein [Hyphomonadaceae bacterium]